MFTENLPQRQNYKVDLYNIEYEFIKIVNRWSEEEVEGNLKYAKQ